MAVPIYDALKAHCASGRAKLHMPGHKGAAGNFPPELAGMLALDTTELPGTFDLLAGEGTCLEQAQSLAAKLYGAGAVLFSAGGATLCIQAMLRAALPHGGKLLCSRVLHRAAANAFCLLNILPVFMVHDNSAGEYFHGRINPEALTDAIAQNPDAKGVYITSPDYFGTMSDIPALAEIAHRAGLPLLVDAAHGAHLEPMGIAQGHGADYAAQSLHKTLPALTGAAWLQLADEKNAQIVREAMEIFGSSSPSFPIVLSIDFAREWLEKTGKQELCDLAAKVRKIKNLLPHTPLGAVDPLRIAFAYDPRLDMGKLLRAAGIEPEYAENGRGILIPTAGNSGEDFAKLESFFAAADLGTPRPQPLIYNRRFCSPRQAFFSKKLPFNVSRRNVVDCPPAVPVVLAGEEFCG
ncbi:MAG: aminotransferase class V-fold PLP-dependent enzyme [Oscillospiraceae bacterium]|nr:aminotransferase class V-fold PLP-dependent enzyme [Oscillospiraceae bacterium]